MLLIGVVMPCPGGTDISMTVTVFNHTGFTFSLYCYDSNNYIQE